ncbi:MAG: asparagine synthase (glutamine-hydrolyzing) [Steroidobacteraceae bacterium]
MCGIFGVLQPSALRLDPEVLQAAHRVQAHRGPDGRGLQTYALGVNSLVLGHQRLAIIDLSDAGLQPMEHGNDGSLIFNGELYNYLELRAELVSAGLSFATRTDSEVLLAALHHWGPAYALGKFNWMGAFAWLDRRGARLVLATDAGTEKPIYHCNDGPRFIFASEVKTVLTLAGRKFPLDRDVVGQFVFQGLSDASTRTFFDGIRRIEPGSYVELDLARERPELRVTRFHSPAYAGDPGQMSLDQFIEELRHTFIDSVRIRLRSDVLVGILLSGGVDSSAIASVSRSLAGHESPPRLLSAVSDDPDVDESPHIATMERHLGQPVSKINLRMAPDTLLTELAEANWYNDAPVAGLSALAHRKLMRRAKELGLTVVLSGQGADEILLGYRKYLGFYLQSLLRQGSVLKAAAVLSGFLANRTIVTDFKVGDAKRYVPLLRKLGRATASVDSGSGMQGAWLRGWQPCALGLGPGTLVERQWLDLRRYSVPSLCHYEDRMSMSASREIRLPFLDPRLIDLLMRAPDSYKLRRGWTKYAFRRAMQPLLPREICWRKDKKGFTNPEGEWLKHELRASVRDAFSPDSLICRNEIMSSPALLKTYDRYCGQAARSGTIWYREIFAPFSLEHWMRRYDAWIA